MYIITRSAWRYCHGRTACEHKHSSDEQDDNYHRRDEHENILDDDTDVAAQSHLPTLIRTLILTSIIVSRCLQMNNDNECGELEQ